MHIQQSYEHPIGYNGSINSPTTQTTQEWFFVFVFLVATPNDNHHEQMT
jgi:hypothetical protein